MFEIIADWLRSVYFDQNCLFILSKMTNNNTNHNHKQWKLHHRQQILAWTGGYTIIVYKHTKLL